MSQIKIKNNFIIVLEKLLSQDIEKKFYKLIIELKKLLRDNIVFEKKSIDGLENELKKQKASIKKSISSLYLKIDKYSETDEKIYLSAAERDLESLIGTLKGLQSEFYTTYVSILHDDALSKRTVFGSSSGKEITLYIDSLGDNLKSLRDALN